jgi:hypothetical protein
MDDAGTVPKHQQGKRKQANKQKKEKIMTDKNNDSDPAVSMT